MRKTWITRLTALLLLMAVLCSSAVAGEWGTIPEIDLHAEIFFDDDCSITELPAGEPAVDLWEGDGLQGDDYPNTWKNTGDQARDIAEIALTQVGYTEIGDNHTKYNIWYFGSDVSQPWCGAFISWCANQAEIPTSIIRKNALASGTAADMNNNTYGCPGLPFVGTTPAVGDILYIDTNKDSKSEHVGLVVGFDDEYVYTVEGNASNSVAARKYARSTGEMWGSRVLFIARPKYTTTGWDCAKQGHKYDGGKETVAATQDQDGVMVFTCTVCGASYRERIPALGDTRNPFRDVFPGQYFTEPVLWALENGIAYGVDSTHYAPMSSCTRAQVVTFLWRLEGTKVPAGISETPFVDVDTSAYYYPALLWAYENKIVAGVDETHFSPNVTVSRGQFVSFLYRYMGNGEVAEPWGFTDVPENAYYARAVAWAAKHGITKGVTETTFGPDLPCRRGDVAAFLYRAVVPA